MNAGEFVEPFAQAVAIALSVMLTFWSRHRGTVVSQPNYLRLAGAIVVAVPVAAALAFLKLRLPFGGLRTSVEFIAALLLQVLGVIWLRPSILRETGISLSPDVITSTLPHVHLFPATRKARRSENARYFLPGLKANLAIGIIAAALVNGEDSSAVDILRLLIPLLLSALLATPFGLPRIHTPSNALRLVAGALLAGIGTFRIGLSLGVVWTRPSLVLVILIASYLVIAAWLTQACREGEARRTSSTQSTTPRRWPRAGSSSRGSMRSASLGVAVCVWALAVGTSVRHHISPVAQMSPSQIGVLLFTGFVLALFLSVIADVRFGGDG